MTLTVVSSLSTSHEITIRCDADCGRTITLIMLGVPATVARTEARRRVRMQDRWEAGWLDADDICPHCILARAGWQSQPGPNHLGRLNPPMISGEPTPPVQREDTP